MSHRSQQPSIHTFAYGNAPQHVAELFLPAGTGSFPVAILIHGGFWRARFSLDLMRGLAHDLVAHNFAVWNIEYRRVGEPGGGWPGTFQDVARAVDYLTTLVASYPLDLKRVVAIGHSAGGHLALWLAARYRLPASEITIGTSPLPLRGVISLAGVNDLDQAWHLHLGGDAVVDLLSGTPAEHPARYQLASPASRLPLGIPQVLLHGTADDRVPLLVSQDYATRAFHAGDIIKLLELPDVDHFALIDPTSQAWHLTLAELQSLLF
ncbi:MAG TPA: alpha/beta hydrolase [Ktedonobacteraceae bacterium]|jgi:acetyl esterase/lipase|nr:alpha/beta hydrolase [Ktedonobacteraceae bacterium]